MKSSKNSLRSALAWCTCRCGFNFFMTGCRPFSSSYLCICFLVVRVYSYIHLLTWSWWNFDALFRGRDRKDFVILHFNTECMDGHVGLCSVKERKVHCTAQIIVELEPASLWLRRVDWRVMVWTDCGGRWNQHGCHSSLKALEFNSGNFKALKVWEWHQSLEVLETLEKVLEFTWGAIGNLF